MRHTRISKRDRDPEGSVSAFWVVDRISRRVGACFGEHVSPQSSKFELVEPTLAEVSQEQSQSECWVHYSKSTASRLSVGPEFIPKEAYHGRVPDFAWIHVVVSGMSTLLGTQSWAGGSRRGGACFARASLGTTLRTARNRGKEEPNWHRYLQVPLPLQERVAAAH
jgi:hypothetical protein